MLRPVSNPPNPWQSESVELLDVAPMAQLTVYEERSKSVLSKSDSPDLDFKYSVNPYRGCYHACAYCYARPYHQYIGWGAGTDFDRKIVVKMNCAVVLQKEISRKSWRHETINFSGITDCYQPLEASYRITRQCLEVCARARNPVTIITKNRLVERDLDILLKLQTNAHVTVFFTISFSEDEMRKQIEPNASPIAKRLQAMKTLSDAGITTGVSVSPIIPGLNDEQVLPILESASSAGATHAFMTLLRLPREVKPVFEERLQEAYPLRAKKVLHGIEDMRNGKRNNSQFGERLKGKGARWDIIEQMFIKQCKKLGIRHGNEITMRSDTSPPPSSSPQLLLDIW